MEILLGVMATLAAQMYKWLEKRYGGEVTNAFIYAIVFGVAIIWAFVIKGTIIPVETLKFAATVIAYAIGIYEMVIKQVVRVIEKIKEKKTDA